MPGRGAILCKFTAAFRESNRMFQATSVATGDKPVHLTDDGLPFALDVQGCDQL